MMDGIIDLYSEGCEVPSLTYTEDPIRDRVVRIEANVMNLVLRVEDLIGKIDDIATTVEQCHWRKVEESNNDRH
jgi:hypothetical protein